MIPRGLNVTCARDLGKFQEVTTRKRNELPRPNGGGFYNARYIVWHVHYATTPLSKCSLAYLCLLSSNYLLCET